MNWKKYGKGAVIALNCLAVLFMVCVIAVSAGYTVLSGDDFTHGVRVGVFHAPFFQYFAASLRYMKEIYLDWQGTYFAMFLQALLSPINNFGLPQLRIVMIFNVLLFTGALFGVVWTAFDFVLTEEKLPQIRMTVFSILLFAILDAEIFTEIFFWYSGAAAYSFPFSFLLLSVMFFLLSNNNRYSKKKKLVFSICAAFFLFCASGGSLTVTGTGCYAVLLLTLGLYLVSHKISVRNIVVTAVGTAGALINVAAPGNFSRHEQNSGGEGFMLLQSVKWAVRNVWEETERLTKETMFGVLLVAMLLLGIYLSDKLRRRLKEYGIVSVLALFAGYVAALPVAVGYAGPFFPNRCCFVLDVVLAVSFLNFAVFMGCCLDRWAGLRDNRSACAVLFVVLFAVFLSSPEKISESAVITVAESMHNGTYRNYYEECVSVYDYLENCEEENVILPMPEYIDNFECFYFDEDETAWVNVGLAQYYGKKSVKREGE
ncbi:MAG: DUF6056 family protein [Blautia sp.]|nr:DUF6056 family protein [Blautia sp.]MCM1200907.1 DUF6056 family protein [Bacteroides fragilis]